MPSPTIVQKHHFQWPLRAAKAITGAPAEKAASNRFVMAATKDRNSRR